MPQQTSPDMHPNPAFRKTAAQTALQHAAEIGFGTLTVSADPVPLLAHIPFLIREDTAELHLVRSNPIARLDPPVKARLAVTGPQGYISPDWYGLPDQVPTWNYTAVHLTGTLHRLPQAELPELLERLSDHFEARLAPKPVWTQSKMTPDALAKMLRQIVPYRLQIEDIQSTFKLNQNKPDTARLSAADHVTDPTLAALMRTPPKDTP